MHGARVRRLIGMCALHVVPLEGSTIAIAFVESQLEQRLCRFATSPKATLLWIETTL
jgi:hypothetical protein